MIIVKRFNNALDHIDQADAPEASDSDQPLLPPTPEALDLKEEPELPIEVKELQSDVTND